MYHFIKRLGQWHKAKNISSNTFCGMPMLGNNYKNIIFKEEREKCPKCFGNGDQRL